MEINNLDSFYCSKTWRDFRTTIIAERGPVSEISGQIIVNPNDLILHHYKTFLTASNYRDANISLNPDNVQIVTKAEHNKIHGGKRKRKEHTTYLVYGPPLSGKTSYVAEHMERGDIVLDIDRIYSAISMQPLYDKPEQLKRNVFAMRDLLIDNIKTRYGYWGSAWIIGGYPIKYQREQIAEQTGANIIYCEATKKECMARLETDRGRQEKETEWAQYINDWFEKYSV